MSADLDEKVTSLEATGVPFVQEPADRPTRSVPG